MIALFFDTETTGFKRPSYTPRLVQLGAILQDTDTGRILAEFNGMVRTGGFPIPEDAANIHGISNELADAFGFAMPSVDQIFAKMVSLADVLVAHNISYDLGIVKDNLPISHQMLQGRDQYCTMLKSTRLVGIKKSHGGGSKWPRLMETYVYFFKKEFDGAHDAMADVRACRDVYLELTKPQPKNVAMEV